MSGALRVLHLLASPRLTGIAEPVLGMCEGLAARGHRVHVAAPHGSKLIERARERGLPVWDRLNLKSGWDLAGMLDDLRWLRRRRGDFDVVHLHHTRTHWLGGLALGGRSPRPALVAHNHAAAPLRHDALHRRLYARMAAILEVSAAPGAEDERRLGRPAFHLPGAVDVERITPSREGHELRRRLGIPEDAVVIAMWARLDHDRRHDLLLSAFAQLRGEFPAAWLLFAGSGAHRAPLLRLAQREGVAERLVVAGRNLLGFAESRACTDILVHLAAGSDGSMRTILEGMAAGLAVVAARVGVAGEYLTHESDGILLARATPATLAEALRRLLADPSSMAELGRQARRRAVVSFALPGQAQRLEAVYRQILGGA